MVSESVFLWKVQIDSAFWFHVIASHLSSPIHILWQCFSSSIYRPGYPDKPTVLSDRDHSAQTSFTTSLLLRHFSQIS